MPKTHTATSTAVGAAAPCTGTATSRPSADADHRAEDAAEAADQGLAARGGVDEDPPGGADGPVPALSRHQLAHDEGEARAGGRLDGLTRGDAGQAASAGGGGRGRRGRCGARSTTAPNRTAEAVSTDRTTAAYSSGSWPGTACRNWATKKVMNAKTPRLCPRGPQRRAYTPAPTTARKVELAGHRTVVQLGRGGEDRQTDGGQQRGGDGLPAHRGVGDREQGEQRGEAAGDGPGEREPGQTADGDREPDAEHGPRGETQPCAPRVRRHEHPLQHCCPAPT